MTTQEVSAWLYALDTATCEADDDGDMEAFYFFIEWFNEFREWAVRECAF